MPDNLVTNIATGGPTLATDEIATVHYPRTKVGFGVDGVYGDVSTSNRLPVDDVDIGLPTDTEATGDGTVIAVLKRIRTLAANTVSIGANTDAEATGDGSLISIVKRLRTQLTNTVSLGAVTDAEVASGDGSIVALLKRLRTVLTSVEAKTAVLGATLPATSSPVTIANKVVIVGPVVAAGATINTDILTNLSGVTGWIDVSNYQSAFLQISWGAGVTAGVVQFEAANDAAGIGSPVIALQSTGGSSSPFTNAFTASTAFAFHLNLTGKFFRIRVITATIGGTVQASICLSQTPLYSHSVDTEASTPATLVDAFANPLAGQLGADNMLFNGATWDRARNNVNTVTGDTGVKTATFNGATQTNHNARGAFITIFMGAVTGTTPSAIPQLQWSPDNGTTWLNFGLAGAAIVATGNHSFLVYPTNLSQAAGATPANLTTGAAQTVAMNSPLPRTWRLVLTITGTTPSFTITSVQVNYIL
jgi:hypothetical protein